MLVEIHKRTRDPRVYEYLMGPVDSNGSIRAAEPELIQGTQYRFETALAHDDFKHSYLSGAFSWEEDYKPSMAEAVRDVVSDGVALLTGGLEEHDFSGLLVQHERKSGFDVHFVVLKRHLRTGRQAPLYNHKKDLALLNTWRRHTNLTHRWSDPHDKWRRRVRDQAPRWCSAEKKEAFRGIDDSVVGGVSRGVVYNRKTLFTFLEDAGWQVTDTSEKGVDILRLAPRRYPRPMEVLHCVRDAIRGAPFTSDLDGFAEASKRGGRMEIGLLFANAAEIAEEFEWRAPIYWWGPEGLRFQFVAGAPEVWQEAIRRISPFGKALRAPYFILGVIGCAGELQRAYLHQAYVTADAFVPTDSSREVLLAARFGKEGRFPFKPVQMEHALPMLEKTGFRLEEGVEWTLRPDFLEFRNDGLMVIEVRGFKERKFPEYDRALLRKQEFYSWIVGEDFFDVIDASGDTEFLELASPLQWEGIEIDIAPLAKSLEF